jgi:hypothetical protein
MGAGELLQCGADKKESEDKMKHTPKRSVEDLLKKPKTKTLSLRIPVELYEQHHLHMVKIGCKAFNKYLVAILKNYIL